MDELVDQRHRLPASVVARRVLEDQRGRRIGSAVGLAIAGALIASVGGAVPILCTAAMFGFGLWLLSLSPPEVLARRMAATALAKVPDVDGAVTLVGIARSLPDRLEAPFSSRACVAFWARHVAHVAPASTIPYDVGQWAAAADFILDCDGTEVQVQAAGALVVFDRDQGDVIENGSPMPMHPDLRDQPRRQEIVVMARDRVVVSGYLVHERAVEAAGAYRDSGMTMVRLVGRRVHPLTVSLLRP